MARMINAWIMMAFMYVVVIVMADRADDVSTAGEWNSGNVSGGRGGGKERKEIARDWLESTYIAAEWKAIHLDHSAFPLVADQLDMSSDPEWKTLSRRYCRLRFPPRLSSRPFPRRYHEPLQYILAVNENFSFYCRGTRKRRDKRKGIKRKRARRRGRRRQKAKQHNQD